MRCAMGWLIISTVKILNGPGYTGYDFLDAGLVLLLVIFCVMQDVKDIIE